MDGTPSDKYDTAGVFVHQFDNLEDWVGGEPWRPCAHGWCTGLVKHMSASIINKDLPYVYNPKRGGIILNMPNEVGIMCAFPHDGGSQDDKDAGCHNKFKLSFPSLGDMLTYQMSNPPITYNEVVVPLDAWEQGVPDIIEAFFFTGKDGENMTRKVHADFLKKYPHLSIADVPLLKLDLKAREPFSYVPERKS